MRVVFLEDVAGVAQGGEIKEVKNGFARNYLIPKRLAVLATQDSLQRVKRLKHQAEDTRLQKLTDMKALGEELNGVQVNIEMRAGASGRLYGSVTNAHVAAELASITGREIDRRTIEIPESIRQVGLHEVRVRLHSDVDANITLLVYPEGTDPAEFVPPEVTEVDEAAEEPTFAEAIEAELATDEPAVAEATEAEPATDEPAVAEAIEAEPATDEPAVAEATEAEPATDEPAVAEAIEAEPATDEPAVAEATGSEAAAEAVDASPDDQPSADADADDKSEGE